jgi:hypothetical protein
VLLHVVLSDAAYRTARLSPNTQHFALKYTCFIGRYAWVPTAASDAAAAAAAATAAALKTEAAPSSAC